MKRTFSAERLCSDMELEGESLGAEGGLQDLSDSYIDAIGDLTEAMDVIGRLVAHLEEEDCPKCRQRLERWRNTLTAAKQRVDDVEAAWWALHDQGLCYGKKKPSKSRLQRAASGPGAHAELAAAVADATSAIAAEQFYTPVQPESAAEHMQVRHGEWQDHADSVEAMIV